jgi:seryl-tRNA synthetase
MLDIKFIRENVSLVKQAAFKKKINVDVDRLVVLDDERLELLRVVEELRGKVNTASAQIPSLTSEVERVQLIEETRITKETLKEKENRYREVSEAWQTLMYQIPNVPDVSVPDGDSDKENVPVKHWGEAQQFPFAFRDHIDLMQSHDMVDFERGSKVHGFRGYYLKNDAVLLSFAIWQHALNFFTSKGFNPMIAPSIVREENLYGTGHLPNDADDVYRTQDNDYLAGTAEVPVMGYHSGEVLNQEEFPVKYLAFSPCYRREAGSHGKDTKGLIRVHEFYKWEQVILCEASHEESVKLHEWINRNTEEFIESLGIPYRTVVNCGGDLGQGQVKKYDIELWVPGEQTYREISSASYFHDFQTRRFNIRYKESDGKMRYAHSLNCTAIPTPRILVSLVENFQQADGTIAVPEVLQQYLGGRTVLGTNNE